MLWEKLDRGNDLLTMEEDFPPILMYWASVIVTARIGKPSVARFATGRSEHRVGRLRRPVVRVEENIIAGHVLECGLLHSVG